MLPALLLPLVLGAAAPTSVLVFPVDMAAGAREGLKEVLSEQLVGLVRKSGAFARINNLDDLATAVDMQRQKQLLDCDTASCWAEIAGALGTDAFLRFSVGKLGERYVLNARLVTTRTAQLLGAAMGKTCGLDEESLGDVLPAVVAQVLDEARLRHVLKRGSLEGTCGKPESPSSPESSRSPLLLGVAGFIASGAVLSLLAAAVLSVVTAVLYVLPTVVFIPAPVGDSHAARSAFFDVTVFIPALFAVVVLLIGPLFLAGAGVTAIAWVMQ